MNNTEPLVNEAFSRQSASFDALNTGNPLTAHLRHIYRREVMQQAPAHASMLELNAGTGLDTLYFAAQGHRILATDLAAGMVQALEQKVQAHQLQQRVQVRQCSFHDLYLLGTRRFDYILSNFGGLNCSLHLDEVLQQFGHHLQPGGKATLVIMPRYSPWELVMALKGDLRTALRRLRRQPVAHIEGVHFPLRYYSPRYVKRALGQDFKVLTLRGIYFAVPPEFYQGFVERYPRLYRVLQKAEGLLGHYFPFHTCCDHYLVTVQKKDQNYDASTC